jgi:hypothetical protein
MTAAHGLPTFFGRRTWEVSSTIYTSLQDFEDPGHLNRFFPEHFFRFFTGKEKTIAPRLPVRLVDASEDFAAGVLKNNYQINNFLVL